MVVTLALLSLFLWQSQTRAWGLPGVWWGLTLFFGARAAQSVPVTLSRLCCLPEAKFQASPLHQ